MQQELASAKSGGETIEVLFSTLESPLLNYACRLAGDLDTAQDMIQEAFMKLQAQFNEVREPRRWLFRTVHNLALNHRRQGKKIVPLDAENSPPTADPRPSPDAEAIRSEAIEMVRLSLETLDERGRELVHLKFNENLSYKEISERTGLKAGNVGYILHYALKSMAEELARNGVVP